MLFFKNVEGRDIVEYHTEYNGCGYDTEEELEELEVNVDDTLFHLEGVLERIENARNILEKFKLTAVEDFLGYLDEIKK